MTTSDHDLGMHRPITRRDFLNGISVSIGASVLGPPSAKAVAQQQAAPAEISEESYPPLRTGMRGSHPGSFEVAHGLREGKAWGAGLDTGETYDLVVVGAGMSGLAAASYFRKKTLPSARILILDNHDDFGGHAKRNEFKVAGRLLIAKGGSTYIEQPATFTPEGRELLREIGVDYNEPTARREPGFYRSLGLKAAVYFDSETFGVDRLVISEASGLGGGGQGWSEQFLAKTPLSARVQQDLLRLVTDKRDYLADLSRPEKIRKLMKTSYEDYLLNIVKVHPDVLLYFHPRGSGVLTTDMTSCWWAFNHGNPGFDGLGLDLAPDAPAELERSRVDHDEPTEFHFPEGNAGVARLLIRSLIPDALPARSMAEAETASVRYAQLDTPAHPVRIRLNSTAVRVRNRGDSATASEVEVTYVRQDNAYRVRAKGCVLACNHSVIPYLVPELPAAQKQALRMAVRGVNMITNVAVHDWRAFERMGLAGIKCPGSNYPGYSTVSLMEQISLGKHNAPQRPDEPIVLSLGGGVHLQSGLRTGRDVFRVARAAMYETSFETFERRIRTHLARVLADGGFDPARDIAAITVNRWPHGYAMGQNLVSDPDWSEEEMPFVRARKRLGRISIANSDAVGVCLMQAAFDQAHRAVDELIPRHMPWWNRV